MRTEHQSEVSGTASAVAVCQYRDGGERLGLLAAADGLADAHIAQAGHGADVASVHLIHCCPGEVVVHKEFGDLAAPQLLVCRVTQTFSPPP